MNCMNCGGELREGVRFCPKCGTPVAQGPTYTPPAYTPTPAAEPVRTSWDAGAMASAAPAPAPRRKSRAGKILLVLLCVFLVIGAGAGVAIYFGVRYVSDKVKSSEPYQLAEKALRESPEAAAALGEIKSLGFPIGAFNTEAGGSGNATFTMSVEGTKASGQYVVVLMRSGGQWHIVNGAVRMANGQTVTIAEEAEPDVSIEVGDSNSPPALPPPPAGERPVPVTVPGAVSAGALDAKAISKPEPPYPPIAKAARAQGRVVVRVTVDEGGQVIMASPVSGHPLLQQASVAAARRATFAPTLSNGKPAKAIGTLTYEFKLPEQ